MKLFSERAVLGSGADVRVSPALVEVEGRFVRSVAPASRGDLAGVPDVIDLGGRLLAPAFVNAHTHLVLSALRGVGGLAALAGNVVESVYFRAEREMTPEDIRSFARIGAYECLLAGTGLVFDHYYRGEAVAEALIEVGLAGGLAPTLQDVAGPGARDWRFHLEETARIDEEARYADAGIAAVLGPHATDTVSDDLWRAAADLAAARNLPIHCHLAQSREEYARSLERHGRPPLRRLLDLGVADAGAGALLVHGLYVGADELAALPPGRVTFGYCPASQAQFDFPAPIDAWREAGAAVALGTDAGSCNDTMDVQAELRLLGLGGSFAVRSSDAWRRFHAAPGEETLAGLVGCRQESHARRVRHAAPAALLASAWSVPGRLHPRLPAGEIRPGALANLLVLDPDHPALWPADDALQALAYGSCAGAIHGLVVNGRWIGQRGDFHRSILGSEHYRAAVAEARGRLRAVLARAGLG